MKGDKNVISVKESKRGEHFDTSSTFNENLIKSGILIIEGTDIKSIDDYSSTSKLFLKDKLAGESSINLNKKIMDKIVYEEKNENMLRDIEKMIIGLGIKEGVERVDDKVIEENYDKNFAKEDKSASHEIHKHSIGSKVKENGDEKFIEAENMNKESEYCEDKKTSKIVNDCIENLSDVSFEDELPDIPDELFDRYECSDFKIFSNRNIQSIDDKNISKEETNEVRNKETKLVGFEEDKDFKDKETEHKISEELVLEDNDKEKCCKINEENETLIKKNDEIMNSNNVNDR